MRKRSTFGKFEYQGDRRKVSPLKVRGYDRQILNNVGVHFDMKRKLVLGDAVFYPDFTIKHPRTGKFITGNISG